MTDLSPSPEPTAPKRWRFPAGRRRRVVVAIAALVVIAAAIIAVTDPFGSSGPTTNGVADNSYPTATTTITQQTLTQQTNVNATLGYAGSYTVSAPSGIAASALAQAQTSALSADQKVSDDKAELAAAKKIASPMNASTLLAARNTVSSDTTTLAAANAQLAADERLDCPASSSSTVSGSSSQNPNSSSSPGSSNSSPGSSSAPSTTSPSGNTGEHAHLADFSGAATSTSGGPPIVSTGSASATTTTDAALSGTVDPNGLSTRYQFEYGRTDAFGQSSPAVDVGSGTTAASVSANITGLSANTTYEFVLVATNADGTTYGSVSTFQTTQSSCVAQRGVIAADSAALSEARDALSEDEVDGNSTVTTDEEQLAADQASAAAASELLSTDQSQASNPDTVVTSLPAVGKVIARGQAVYSLNGAPVPLFYGAITFYRALYPGESGPDVTELQQNLNALGFAAGTSGSFDGQTHSAVEAWQRSNGEAPTGVVSLGDVVIEPSSIQVDTVPASLGATVQPGGAILTASSTSRQVTISLDASQQTEVKVGDPVTVTLPDNSTTPGVVSSVGTVATTPAGTQGNTGATPTITVEVTLTNPKATGDLDQAPVEVSITNATAPNALVVPVDALLALAGGGYSLEEVGAGGVHHLVPVSLGLFDDALGDVQVTGSDLAVGQKIVIPNT